jgi:hypothetical protein
LEPRQEHLARRRQARRDHEAGVRRLQLPRGQRFGKMAACFPFARLLPSTTAEIDETLFRLIVVRWLPQDHTSFA